MITLQTNRLVLRHFQLSDVDALTSVFGDADVMQYGAGVQSPEWTRDWVTRAIAGYQAQPGLGPFGVVKKNTTTFLGYCGLFSFPDICGQAEIEIGYRLAKAYWGYGYATEAATAVKNYAFDSLGLSRVISIIDPDNLASIRVAQKTGMRFEKEVMLEGYTYPDHVYALTR